MDFEVLVTVSLGDQEIQEWVHASNGGWTFFVNGPRHAARKEFTNQGLASIGQRHP